MHYYYWNGEGWNGFDFFISLMVSVLWIVLLVWVIRTLVRSRYWKHLDAPRTPLDIARERYAKGEITKQELDDIKKELQG